MKHPISWRQCRLSNNFLANSRKPPFGNPTLLTALLCAVLICVPAHETALAQTVIDGGEVVTIPGDRPNPWTIPGTGLLTIGQTGSDTLNILADGVVNSEDVLVGAGSMGSLTVTGPGSRLTVAFAANGLGVITVGIDGLNGVDGNGIMTVANGGAVTGQALSVGVFEGSTGTVTIMGSDSRVTTTGVIWVGQQGGTGTLIIEDGGFASGQSGAIGIFPDSTGTIAVRGAGSRLELTSGALSLGSGSGASGTLTVQDAGVVKGSFLGIGSSGGSVGIVNIGAASGEAAVSPGFLEIPVIGFGSGTGTINFNHTGTAYEFASNISGLGSITHLAGTTILTGDSSGFTGLTDVSGGDLRVNGTLGGATQIDNGGTLSGIGTLTGAVTAANGGTISPGDGAVGTLTVGSLALSSGSSLNFDLGTPDMVGGLSNDLIVVNGDLTLDGTLNVADAGGFGAGVYRLIDYGGTLTDNGLEIGTVPGGVSPSDLMVRTSTPTKSI